MARPKLSRWLLLITVAAMAPLVLALFYSLYVLHTSREREAHQEAMRVAELLALEMQRIVSGVGNVLVTASTAPVVRKGSPEDCAAFLGEVTNRLEGIATIGVISVNGTLKCRQDGQGLGVSLVDRPYFQEALKTKDVVVGDYTQSRISGKALLPLALSYRDDRGNVLGVVATSVDLTWLQHLIEQRAFPKDAAVTVADRHGTILARYPFPERFVGTQIPEKYHYLVNAPSPGTIELLSQDGTRRIMAYMPVSSDPKGLYLSTGLSVNNTFAAIKKATLLGILTTVFTALLAALLSWQISRYAIKKPVGQILKAISSWRRSDLTVKSDLRGDDEFGTIGSAFDELVDELSVARQRNELIMSELDHRVKNVLTLIQSIARQSFRNEKVSAEAQERFSNRLLAVSGTFTLLRKGDWQSTALTDLVDAAIAPFNDGEKPQIHTAGPTITIHPSAALTIGMAIHELCTNAVKYGALCTAEGSVQLRWEIASTTPQMLELTWVEHDGPPVCAPDKVGFGSTMIERAVTAQLGGKVNVEYLPQGLRCRMSIPTENLVLEPGNTQLGLHGASGSAAKSKQAAQ